MMIEIAGGIVIAVLILYLLRFCIAICIFLFAFFLDRKEFRREVLHHELATHYVTIEGQTYYKYQLGQEIYLLSYIASKKILEISKQDQNGIVLVHFIPGLNLDEAYVEAEVWFMTFKKTG